MTISGFDVISIILMIVRSGQIYALPKQLNYIETFINKSIVSDLWLDFDLVVCCLAFEASVEPILAPTSGLSSSSNETADGSS